MGNKVRFVRAIQAIAGESRVWAADEQALYWVDVTAPSVHRFLPQTGRNETWKLPDTTGSIAVRERGGLVAATRSGFCFVDIPSGRTTPVVDPEWNAYRRTETFYRRRNAYVLEPRPNS